MYKIKEFSKITGLPTSTLRYYDKEGILIPSFRDKETNYRYYTEEEFKKANLLLLLRRNHFSIAEIKDILMTLTNYEELSYYLIEKKQQLKQEIRTLQQQIQLLDNLISDTRIQPSVQTYTISKTILEAQDYIYREFSGPYDEMSDEVNILYSQGKNWVTGPLFLLDNFSSESNTYRIGLPVSKKIEHSQITNDRLPQQRGIQLTHNGSYTTIGNAYKYLMDYAKKEKIQTEEHFCTQFVKGPGKLFKGNVNSYITKIILLTTD